MQRYKEVEAKASEGSAGSPGEVVPRTIGAIDEGGQACLPGRRVHLRVVDDQGPATQGPARPRTLPTRAFSKAEAAALAEEYPADEFADLARPKTRADCLPGGCNEERPCPWVSCAAHLALEVREHGTYASVKVSFPDVEVWDMAETCILDVADRGGATLEEVAALMNLTHERVRQIETRALETLGALPMAREIEVGDR